MDLARVECLKVSDYGLREGLLLEAIQRRS
jgi:exopolyphosphatase/pppGpp-phosphohydrolase